MATNPPITIGPFANVPAPGSGVKSDWAQQITNYVLRGAWTPVTFQNGWVNFAAGSNACQYRKEGDRVFLRGMMKSGTLGNVIAFALPAGFRPPADVYLATVSNALFGYCNILAADGGFRPQAVNASWVSIECSFSTVT